MATAPTPIDAVDGARLPLARLPFVSLRAWC
ncbi:hypothetical protein PSP6_980007 [Paraburkholderia tropica]|nr:hypothetical protein PSP6_980007 [Paraburkholderia tropica]